MIDNEFVKEAREANAKGLDAGYTVSELLKVINQQQAENERLKKQNDSKFEQWLILDKRTEEKYAKLYEEAKEIVKSEAYKEFAEKITEIFMQYAHLHSYADGARKDYIETVDGKEIEMQSVWDVITLQKNGMAEYEEMNRLQNNIELIEKDRLLTELEKEFRLLAKELTEKNDFKEELK